MIANAANVSIIIELSIKQPEGENTIQRTLFQINQTYKSMLKIYQCIVNGRRMEECMVAWEQGRCAWFSPSAPKLISAHLNHRTPPCKPDVLLGECRKVSILNFVIFTCLGLKFASLEFCAYIKNIVPNSQSLCHWFLIYQILI